MKSKYQAAAAAIFLSAGTAGIQVFAQDLAATGNSSQTAGQGGDVVARVKAALHSDPGLFDKHIDVSSKNGKVVMNGFVATAQDMQKAVKAANKAAGEGRVVNNLTIKEGGGGGSG